MPSVFRDEVSPSDDVENVGEIVETTYRYSRVLLEQFDFDQKAPLVSRSIALAACRLMFAAFTDHLILKRTGTTKNNLLSEMLLGGAGIGWARASIASVS